MIDVFRYINLRFEIQHLFPTEIANGVDAADARRLLASINFDLESKGNKMALLATPGMRDAIRNAPEAVQQAFADAGFGENTQNSYRNPNAHPEYNQFIIQTLAALSNEADLAGWDKTARERAVFDFHRYITKINADGFPPVQGTDTATFAQGWATERGNKDYADPTSFDTSGVDEYRSSFDATLVDSGASNNNECPSSDKLRHAEALA